jgi:hypothetical protein
VASWQKRLEGLVVARPIWGSLLVGVLWGIVWWLGFGLFNHALNLFAFEIAMGGGILLFGPAVFIMERRTRTHRPPQN